MAVTLHVNNAQGFLASPVVPGDTTIVLQTGQGALFPDIAPGLEQFYVTVENRALAGSMEIMLVTAKAVDSFTVLRGQQGTLPLSFAAGVSVSNRVTADFLNSFDSRIAEAIETAEAAAVAAATSLAAATAANDGLALKANTASPTLTGIPAAPTAAPGTSTTQLATTAFVTAAVAAAGGGGGGDADLDSPAFVGVPTAPTAAPGTDTTQLATTAFVTAAVNTATAGLAPLADPTFTGTPDAPTPPPGSNNTQLATTAFVVAAISSKADVTSPTLLGTPAAPTASPGTNTTQIATTAFVAAAVAAGSSVPDPLIWATLVSPVFTGIPAAPTAISGTNTTQLATTAFVTTAVGQGLANYVYFTGDPSEEGPLWKQPGTNQATVVPAVTSPMTPGSTLYVTLAGQLASLLTIELFEQYLLEAPIGNAGLGFNAAGSALVQRTPAQQAALLPMASTTVVGPVELATIAETNTGNDATRAVTPDALAGSYAGTAVVMLPVCDTDTDLPVNFVDQIIFSAPVTPAMVGMNIIAAGVVVDNVGTTGSATFNIRRKRAGATATVLSTPITLAANAYAASTASSGVINTANDDLALGDTLVGYAVANTLSPIPQGVTMWVEAQKP